MELLLRARERGQVVTPGHNGQNGHNGSSNGSSNGNSKGYYFAVVPEYPSYAELGKMAGPLVRRPHVLVLPCPTPIPWVIGGISQALATLRRRPDDLNLDKIQEALAPSWACSAEAAKRDLAFAPPKIPAGTAGRDGELVSAGAVAVDFSFEFPASRSKLPA